MMISCLVGVRGPVLLPELCVGWKTGQNGRRHEIQGNIRSPGIELLTQLMEI